MKGFLLAISALAAFGCGQSRVNEAEKRAAEAERAAARFEAADFRSMEHAVQGLRDELAARSQAAATAEQKLRDLHEALAALWRGDPAAMHEMLAQAKVPADLAPFLEKAQQSAGGTASERRFAEAIEKGNLDELARLLVGFEEKAIASADEKPANEGAEECQRPTVRYQCSPLASDEPAAPRRMLCRAEALAATFVLSVEDARLFVRRLTPAVTADLRVVRSFGREWWVVRRTHGEKVSAQSADRGAEASARSWVAFLRLSDNAATERMAIAEADKVSLTPADLDGDRMEEIVEVAPGLARAVHYDRKSKDISLWTAAEICATPGASALASLKPACDEVERKEQEKAAAAAKRAEEIAKAPSPVATLDAMRDAMMRCDVAAAAKLCTKAAAANERFNDVFKNEEERQECMQHARERLASVTFSAFTASGDRAIVDVKDGTKERKQVLIFMDGAWKVANDGETGDGVAR